ncbi:MAG: 4Fe-4S binding protein [Candidatus Jordarchaeum sp.]|uniref:4Fe-4S binding protein n=1 Tax=Candidatus Jordarchaeum sp. TaxID=2823881 RepID=UPI00404B3505
MARVKINTKKCLGCGNCVSVCPSCKERILYESGFNSCEIENSEEPICVINGIAVVVKPELCRICRVMDCEKVCPSGALTIET